MSAVFPPDLPQVLQDHHRRIRALEASPSAIDQPWVDIGLGVFQNGWLPLIDTEDPVGYVITASQWLGLRGRLYSGSDGLTAFTLPVFPAKDHTFVGDLSNGRSALGSGGAGGNTGAVTITSTGNVIPFISPPGWLSSVPMSLMSTVGVETGLENFAYWTNASGNIYAFLAAGGFGVKAAATPSAKGAIYTGGEQHTDAELEATATANTTNLYLGLRCQLPYTPGSMNYPAGYWLDVPHNAGGTITMKIYDLFGVGVDYAGGATSPGYGNGDVITFRINYGAVTALKNNTPFLQVQPGSDQSHVWSSGYFGVGANGTHGLSLISDLVGRLPKNVGVSLANCWVKL